MSQDQGSNPTTQFGVERINHEAIIDHTDDHNNQSKLIKSHISTQVLTSTVAYRNLVMFLTLSYPSTKRDIIPTQQSLTMQQS